MGACRSRSMPSLIERASFRNSRWTRAKRCLQGGHADERQVRDYGPGSSGTNKTCATRESMNTHLLQQEGCQARSKCRQVEHRAWSHTQYPSVSPQSCFKYATRKPTQNQLYPDAPGGQE